MPYIGAAEGRRQPACPRRLGEEADARTPRRPSARPLAAEGGGGQTFKPVHGGGSRRREEASFILPSLPYLTSHHSVAAPIILRAGRKGIHFAVSSRMGIRAGILTGSIQCLQDLFAGNLVATSAVPHVLH